MKHLAKKISVGPSILNANFSILKQECDSLIASGAGHLHLDVMDGHFVPNISFGAPIVEALRKNYPNQYLDVHLMVSEPEKWIKPMKLAGASSYTFHTEAVSDNPSKICEILSKIKTEGMDAGISLKPGTSVDVALECLNQTLEANPSSATINQILIMTVEPGFGGQSFMLEMMEKVKKVRDWAKTNNRHDLIIQVDGGVKPGETAKASAESGANYFVSGSGVVKAKCRKSAIDSMKNDLEEFFVIE